jgi:hypothetical protein
MGAQKSTRGLRLRQPHDSIKADMELVSRQVGYQTRNPLGAPSSHALGIREEQSS